MRKKAIICGIMLTGVLCVMGISGRSACAQTITVRLVQVLASNRGEEYVDPTLGALGDKLKKRYPYRNFRKVGSGSASGRVGGSVRFSLHGGMVLTLGLKGYEAPMVLMHATVTSAEEAITAMNLKVRESRTVILSVPLGADALILAITPHLT